MASILKPTGMDTTTGQFKIATAGDLMNGLPIIGGIPTVALTAAAGSGATYSIVGSNHAGKIVINTGISLLSTGAVLTLTFADGFSFPSGCAVTFSSGDVNFASVITKLFCTTTTSSVTLSTALALSIGTTYTGFYTISGW